MQLPQGPGEYGRPAARAENVFRVKSVSRALIDSQEEETSEVGALVEAVLDEHGKRPSTRGEAVSVQEQTRHRNVHLVAKVNHAFGTALASTSSRSTSGLSERVAVSLGWQRNRRLRPQVKVLPRAPNTNFSATITIGSTAPFP